MKRGGGGGGFSYDSLIFWDFLVSFNASYMFCIFYFFFFFVSPLLHLMLCSVCLALCGMNFIDYEDKVSSYFGNFPFFCLAL